MRKITRVDQLTSVLWCFAKLRYQSQLGDEHLKVAAQIITNEPQLKTYIAARNLWNFYALDFYDKVAFDRFSQVITNSETHQIHDLDIANSLRAFAHFQHFDYDCLEVLVKETI